MYVCVYVYTTPWLSAFTSTLFETESLVIHLCIPQANWSKSLLKILLIPPSLSEREDYRLAPSCWTFYVLGIQTQVFMFVQQALCPVSCLPSSCFCFEIGSM